LHEEKCFVDESLSLGVPEQSVGTIAWLERTIILTIAPR